MPDEIIGEDVSQPEELPTEETTEVPTEEITSETPTEQKPTQQPDPELLKLFNSVKEEVGQKRFDGLMSAWQRDRRRLLQQESKPQSITEIHEPPKTGGDDAWLDYLDKRLDALRSKRLQEEEEKTKREMEEVLIEFPNFTEEQVANTAAEYSEEGKGMIPFKMAAKILVNLQKGSQAGKSLAQQEIDKKRLAGGISGKAEAESLGGLRPFNPEKDSGKSFDQLIEDAKKETGIK